MNAFKMLCLKPDIPESIVLLEKYSVYMHGIFNSQSQLTRNLSILVLFLAILVLLCRFGSPSHVLNKCAKGILYLNIYHFFWGQISFSDLWVDWFVGLLVGISYGLHMGGSYEGYVPGRVLQFLLQRDPPYRSRLALLITGVSSCLPADRVLAVHPVTRAGPGVDLDCPVVLDNLVVEVAGGDVHEDV